MLNDVMMCLNKTVDNPAAFAYFTCHRVERFEVGRCRNVSVRLSVGRNPDRDRRPQLGDLLRVVTVVFEDQMEVWQSGRQGRHASFEN